MGKRIILALFLVISMVMEQTGIMAMEVGTESVTAIYGAADEKGFDIQDGVLVKYTGSSTKVVIPKSVTSIGAEAFASCGIKEVTIPGTVESIGDSAFNKCGLLTNVKIENGVKSIGEYAFASCVELREIELPKSVLSIGAAAFRYCDFLAKVTLSEGLERIGDGAFGVCVNLKEIALPRSLKSIGNGAFYECSITEAALSGNMESLGEKAFQNCNYLTAVTIENGLKSIGECAFIGCSSLTEMTLPQSVESIGEGLLYGCTGVESVNVAAGNKIYDSPDGSNAIVEKESKKLLVGCKNTIVPPDVKSIARYAFAGCSGLKEITLPGVVESIGERAFIECAGLEKAAILGNVTSIGKEAFYNCESLAEMVIPASVTSIEDSTFYGCTGLKEVIIPNSVKNIGYHAFCFCNSLTQVIIPGSVVNIGDRSFYACKSLAKVEIRNGVEMIDICAFDGCSELKEVAIPASVTDIGYQVFNSCKDLTVFGEEGSYAKKYADRFEYKFKPISEWENIPEIINIATCQIDLSQASYIYDGTEKEPIVTVKDGDKVLALGTDYMLTYTNNKAVGTATVIITGMGSYTGTAAKTFEIKNAESVTPPAATYKSQNITCDKKTYDKKFGDKPFFINAKGMIGSVTYASTDEKVAIVDGKGKVTIKGTGIAAIKINAAGNNEYNAANLEIAINVSPKKPSLQKLKVLKGKKLKVSWKKDKQASGYEIQYGTDKHFGKKNTKKVLVRKMSVTTKELTKLKRGKRYYVRICAYKKAEAGGKTKTLRSAWCKAKRSGKIK